ncbi:CHRD domain-containing protein [Bizionia sediminis]|uniref:CHRD domain-containing protein n=1 Tax=Bizionia sediminis TaxID=1737064 RepID=A0ABW5KSX0_9FLAO
MKQSFKLFAYLTGLLLAFNCASDDNISRIDSKLIATTYTFTAINNPAITGEARLIKNEDASVSIEIKLSGTTGTEFYPASIRFNTAAEGGAVVVDLTDVSSATGRSKTTFSTLNDGSDITYETLLDFDGFIDIRTDISSTATIIAQADIGQNELTGTTKTYSLNTRDVPGISGSIKFSERKNGEALARIELLNTVAGSVHPAHIHNNTALEGGAIAFTFNPVSGDTGVSRTNLSMLDDGTPFNYSNVVTFNGYVNVHASETDLGTIVAQGDIGKNGLTGEFVSYPLNELDVPGVQGTATFFKRENGNALAVIELENTTAGLMHPAHIHANNISTTGPVILSFNPVNGDTGKSQTNITQLDDASAFDYNAVLQVDGYINVHESATNLNTIIAQGNIGINAAN